MLQCYNRGCGSKYDPNENTDDSCCHHPGEPYFHDAYKGWNCCNKKSVDFTEFLNMKGCTLSRHSNIKPPESEKPVKSADVDEAPVEVRQPIRMTLQRPSFDSNLITVKPTVLPGLKDAIDALKVVPTAKAVDSRKDGEVPLGTACQNRGCNYSYQSSDCNYTECRHHSGFPIFHEGMKYWTCCQKKTSDFDAFLNQKGCEFGRHKWFKEDDDSKSVNCRYDWHQTGSSVHLSIYAKLYHYELSTVKVNPIRLKVSLVFPAQDNAQFDMDLELRGIIKPEETTVKMFGTKVEIVMPKAEASSWAKLDFPRAKSNPEPNPDPQPDPAEGDSDSEPDLDDIETVSAGVKISNIW